MNNNNNNLFISLAEIKTLTLEITSFCNLHCPQCPRYSADGFLNNNLDLEHLNINILKNIQLDKFPNLKNIVFEGDNGDALMHPDILSFITFFKGYNIHITTNGSIRSNAWWSKLANIKDLSVTFSIDGLKDTNEVYRIGADFDKILSNANAFIKAGGHAIWKYIVFQHNESQIATANKLAATMGFSEFNTIMSERSWFHGNAWEVYIEGKYQYDIHPTTKLIDFNGTKHIANEKHNVSPKNCLLKKYGDLYINHKGHILPCCMTSSYTYMSNIKSQMWQHILGEITDISIYDHTLDDILTSNVYTDLIPNSFDGLPWGAPCCTTFCASI